MPKKIIIGSELLIGHSQGCNNDAIEEIVGKLLLKNRFSLAIAESCTGGLISSKITDVPGSSKYFKGGIIAYDNNIKERILKVPKKYLIDYGAVSSEVAKKMAKNVQKIFISSIGLSITGVAGPGGGTKAKPVGLVYIAIADEIQTCCEKFLFDGNRSEIKEKVCFAALNIVINSLET